MSEKVRDIIREEGENKKWSEYINAGMKITQCVPLFSAININTQKKKHAQLRDFKKIITLSNTMCG